MRYEEINNLCNRTEKSIKVGNSFEPTLIEQIQHFAHKVEYLPDEMGQDGSIIEENCKVFGAEKFAYLKVVLTRCKISSSVVVTIDRVTLVRSLMYTLPQYLYTILESAVSRT
jgi:hypothetical protein